MILSKKEWYLEFNRSVLHPLMIVLTPFLFIMAVSGIVDALLGYNGFDSFKAGGFLFPIILLLTGMEEVIVGNILFKENIRGFQRAREIIYLLVLAFILFFVLQKGTLTFRLESLKKWQYIYAGFCMVVQWLLSYKIHICLRDREILLAALEDRNAVELKKTLRASSEMASLTLFRLREYKRIVLSFQITVFLLLLLLFVLKVEVSLFLVVLAMFNGLAGVLFTLIANNAIGDQFLLAEGIFVNQYYQRRRIIHALLILLIILFLVLFLTRNTSLLSLSIFDPFFKWLSNLFSKDGRLDYLPRRTVRPVYRQDFLEMFLKLDQHSSPLSVILRIIFIVLGRIILIGLGVLLLYFLVRPLLSDYFLEKVRSLHPLKVLWKKLVALANYLIRLFRDFVKWNPSPFQKAGEEKDAFRKWKRLKLRRPGFFKRIELGRILKVFMRLIRWAKRRGVAYRSSIAPVEYALLVAESVPSAREALTQAMMIMEEALFSPRLLARDKFQRYLSLVRDIIKRKV